MKGSLIVLPLHHPTRMPWRVGDHRRAAPSPSVDSPSPVALWHREGKFEGPEGKDVAQGEARITGWGGALDVWPKALPQRKSRGKEERP